MITLVSLYLSLHGFVFYCVHIERKYISFNFHLRELFADVVILDIMMGTAFLV